MEENQIVVVENKGGSKQKGKRIMLVSLIILVLLLIVYVVKLEINNSGPLTQSWNTLQKYLKAAQNKDVETLKNLSYQVSDSCKNYNESAENKKDCDQKMDTVAYFGSVFVKKEFINVWSDDRQTILSTDFKWDEDKDRMARSRGIVFFVKGEDGVLKVLSFNDAKGAFVSKGDAKKEELEARLIRYTEDMDMDGKEDYLEECLSAAQTEFCKKTDPKVRDTDGDGLWDGIQVLFK